MVMKTKALDLKQRKRITSINFQKNDSICMKNTRKKTTNDLSPIRLIKRKKKTMKDISVNKLPIKHLINPVSHINNVKAEHTRKIDFYPRRYKTINQENTNTYFDSDTHNENKHFTSINDRKNMLEMNKKGNYIVKRPYYMNRIKERKLIIRNIDMMTRDTLKKESIVKNENNINCVAPKEKCYYRKPLIPNNNINFDNIIHQFKNNMPLKLNTSTQLKLPIKYNRINSIQPYLNPDNIKTNFKSDNNNSKLLESNFNTLMSQIKKTQNENDDNCKVNGYNKNRMQFVRKSRTCNHILNKKKINFQCDSKKNKGIVDKTNTVSKSKALNISIISDKSKLIIKKRPLIRNKTNNILNKYLKNMDKIVSKSKNTATTKDLVVIKDVKVPDNIDLLNKDNKIKGISPTARLKTINKIIFKTPKKMNLRCSKPLISSKSKSIILPDHVDNRPSSCSKSNIKKNLLFKKTDCEKKHTNILKNKKSLKNIVKLSSDIIKNPYNIVNKKLHTDLKSKETKKNIIDSKKNSKKYMTRRINTKTIEANTSNCNMIKLTKATQIKCNKIARALKSNKNNYSCKSKVKNNIKQKKDICNNAMLNHNEINPIQHQIQYTNNNYNPNTTIETGIFKKETDSLNNSIIRPPKKGINKTERIKIEKTNKIKPSKISKSLLMKTTIKNKNKIKHKLNKKEKNMNTHSLKKCIIKSRKPTIKLIKLNITKINTLPNKKKINLKTSIISQSRSLNCKTKSIPNTSIEKQKTVKTECTNQILKHVVKIKKHKKNAPKTLFNLPIAKDVPTIKVNTVSSSQHEQINPQHIGVPLSLKENDPYPKNEIKHKTGHIYDLLILCNQKKTLRFCDIISTAKAKECVKIGEGISGEVFKVRRTKQSKFGEGLSALKIVPAGFNEQFDQKSYEEIRKEIIITQSLSSLKCTTDNMTSSFVVLKSVHIIKGKYPKELLSKWDKYKDTFISENIRPDVYSSDQIYVVFEFVASGSDFESIKLRGFKQVQSVLKQTILALAVAENQLKFEHRDMHWGNILLQCDDKFETDECVLKGESLKIKISGVKLTIIDFTLSRITKDEEHLFLDLSNDIELFEGVGEYQFDIYRMMKAKNGNNWEIFTPNSNVYWLHYIADKLLNSANYSEKLTNEESNELSLYKNSIIKCSSANQVYEKMKTSKLFVE